MEKTIKAKSDPEVSLKEHSVRTLEEAKMLVEKSGIENEILHDITIIASAFHDLGKCTENFQEHINGTLTGNVLAHNVLSYRIFNDYIKVAVDDYHIASEEDTEDLDMKELILRAILLHHPLPYNIDDKKNEELNYDLELDEDTFIPFIEEMIAIVSPYLKCTTLSFKKKKKMMKKLEYFYGPGGEATRNNAFLNVANGIVRFADILASGGGPFEDYVNLTFDPSKVEIKKPAHYDGRFYKQLEYARKMISKKFSELNAPTGFGKTIIYALWSLLVNNRKTISVSPTNEIAISNYNSIMNELAALGLEDTVKVGLLLTNKWIIGGEYGDRNDIIVTNIDNYVRPIFKCDSRKSMCFNLNFCNVVFDEYQQYASSSALFSLFEIALYGRNLCKNSKTVLASATPNEFLLQSVFLKKEREDIKIDIDFSDYGKKLYKCEFREYNPDLDTENFAIAYNSVSMSQKKARENGWLNFHTAFNEKDKKKIRETILKAHGKKSSPEDKNTVLCCTNILSTGIDVSFKKMIMCGLPMEEEIQMAGRCNRWNEYPEGGTLVFASPVKDSSESMAIESKYSKELRDMEYKMLKEKIGDKTISLNELYSIVDEIKKDEKYSKKLETFMDICRSESYENLNKLTYTYASYSEGDESIISSKPSVRTIKGRENDAELFVIVGDGTMEISDAVQKNYLDKKKLCDEHAMEMYEFIKKNGLEGIYYKGKIAWVFKKYYDKGDKDSLGEKYMDIAKHSSTPFILDAKKFVYDGKLGLRKRM